MVIKCDPSKVRLIDGQENRLATANITIDDAFVVCNLSVMNGKNGLFVNMPSTKGKDKDGNVKYYDTAFPLSKDLRADINKAVLDAYTEKINALQRGTQNRDNGNSENTNEQSTSEQPDDYPEYY